LQEWRTRIAEKTVLTLRLRASCPHEYLINPLRSGYGGPRWFAILVSKLMPAPDLSILLETEGKTLTSGGVGHCTVILDASQPTASGTEEAYAAIVDMLEQRTRQQLKRRFAFRAERNSTSIAERPAGQ
jgi:hypothetical protein